ncbi:hypothetical protein LB543_22495 [Mesorhizobium sp. ESP7-2]|uniref:DUF6894 family protein n=1 Tax=Mesorhizobium sp. ESP7-2 TaxID=2876622 RepID=UPI001CCD36D6|nr:hypothetical protein [Mesorhizobium sp. ESP7-2]MBZ9709493.1 hypothetical protein [Mesorhizobium sp. ESP7-2]
MPSYHFHVDDGALVPDVEGTELPDLHTARTEAVRAMGTMLADLGGDLVGGGHTWMMHVTDAANVLLFSLTFSSIVPAGKVTFLPEDQVSVAPVPGDL